MNLSQQILNKYKFQFLGRETDPLFQFLDQEYVKMSQFRFKWIFLVSIERIHNPENVQIYFFNFWLLGKKLFHQD